MVVWIKLAFRLGLGTTPWRYRRIRSRPVAARRFHTATRIVDAGLDVRPAHAATSQAPSGQLQASRLALDTCRHENPWPTLPPVFDPGGVSVLLRLTQKPCETSRMMEGRLQPRVKENPGYSLGAEAENDRRAKTVEEVLRRTLQLRDQARLTRNLALVGVGFVCVVALIQWFDGGNQDYGATIAMGSLAMAAFIIGGEKASVLSRVEQILLEEAERGKFAVAKRQATGCSHCSYRVTLAMPIQQFVADHDDPLSVHEPDQPEAFAWSPGRVAAAIELRTKPVGQLTRATYQAALACRINRLVANEAVDHALYLLRQIEENEWTVNTNDLTRIGEALIAGSNALHEKIDFPLGGVASSVLVHDPELLAFLRDDDSLESFLNSIYDYTR